MSSNESDTNSEKFIPGKMYLSINFTTLFLCLGCRTGTNWGENKVLFSYVVLGHSNRTHLKRTGILEMYRSRKHWIEIDEEKWRKHGLRLHQEK